jgi:glycosyltransferase involved in cell wall biosynthesis
VLASHNPWELVCNTYDHPDEQLFYIPNGFDTGAFSPPSPVEVETARSAIEDRHEMNLNTDVVVWVNHLTGHKRPKLGIRAFEQLREKHTDTSFLLIGDGEQKATCQDLVTSVPDAHYLGFIDHSEIAQYFQSGDVSLVTSRSEGFSNVIYESMACGLPVVTATKFDQIGTGEFGRYLPVESAAAEIADGLAAALDRSDELGARARNHVVENHGIQIFGDKYMQLYKWLMDRRDRPAFSTTWVSETLTRVQGEW